MRRIGAVMAPVLAAIVAIGLVLAPAASGPVRAAAPDLTIVTNATYDVQPEAQRVHVTLQLTATNHLKDTTTRRFYFDRAALAVLPGTTGFEISGGTGRPTVAVAQQAADYTLLSIVFGQRINSQNSASFTLQFDLPDPGGEPGRDVRVGSAFVSFPVWAFATDATPGSTVRVVFPEGFTVGLEAGTLPEPTTGADGRTIFESGPLDAPLDFFAYFVADAPSAFLASSRRAVIDSTPAELIIRAWPDDPDWSGRVGDLFQRGLPALADAIGLSWTRTEPLVVQEAVSRTTGGYAGLFDPANGFVEVAYYAGAFVVLHEAAHAWFNGGLLADRWANEGFASHYAEAAARALGVEAVAEALTDELRAHRIPLNAWGQIGTESDDTEDYAYAASRQLAGLVAERAGEAVLTEVWAAATRGEGAYQPSAGLPTEPVDEVPDWRGLLDLLEDHAGEPFDDLWLAWVVRDEEAGLIADRAAARQLYGAVATEAADWRLPRPIRAALRAWQFGQATELLRDARRVLAARVELETGSRSAGLELPATLRSAFEGDAGFAAALTEADAQKAVIAAYETASAHRIERPGPLETLGLIGSQPDATLAAAADAFAAGDLPASFDLAAEAEATWRGAADIGRNRIISGIGVVLLVGLGLAFGVSALRRRRARRAGATTPDLA